MTQFLDLQKQVLELQVQLNKSREDNAYLIAGFVQFRKQYYEDLKKERELYDGVSYRERYNFEKQQKLIQELIATREEVEKLQEKLGLETSQKFALERQLAKLKKK
jgi:hypothetical protein